MSVRDRIINEIIRIEGGYSNDPDDSGGATCWGITEAVARRYGYTRHMKELPREIAYKIYSDWYWHSLNLDLIEDISPSIAEELADTGVNCGVIVAGRFLQRSLNVFNNKQKYYPDLKVDGKIGPITVRALEKYLSKRGEEGEIVLYRALNSLQGARYISLAERREKDEKYIYGWFSARVS